MIIASVILTAALGSCSEPARCIGNNINNSIFSHNFVCEDKDYVYYTRGIDDNIKRIGKKDNSADELKYKGYNLNICKNYLYFQDGRNFYRVNIKDTESEPEVIFGYFCGYYLICDNKIYTAPYTTDIYKMDPDGSHKEKYFDVSYDKRHFICGADDKYIYAVFINDTEEVSVGGKTMRSWTLSRMDRKRKEEKAEKLFPVYFEAYADLRFNDFMVVLKEYAYCVTNGEISRNKLSVGLEKETICKIDPNTNVIAVTEQGIYLKDNDSGVMYKISPNGKIKEQIEIELTGDELFFVSIFDNKLYYIQDNTILNFND